MQPNDLYEGRKSIELKKGDNLFFQANPYLPIQYSDLQKTPPPVLGHILTNEPISYTATLTDAKDNVLKSIQYETPAGFNPIENELINNDNFFTVPPNWKIVLHVPKPCFAWLHPWIVNFTIRMSREYTEIPGNIFKPFEEKTFYFTAWIDGKPVAQNCLYQLSNIWWHDGHYIKKDMRKTSIFFPLVREIIYYSAKITDTVNWHGFNFLPEGLTRTHNFGIRRRILLVCYKGFPIRLDRYKEYRKKFKLGPRGFVTTVQDDLRYLDPLSSDDVPRRQPLLLSS
jgi:hypothetical protein